MNTKFFHQYDMAFSAGERAGCTAGVGLFFGCKIVTYAFLVFVFCLFFWHSMLTIIHNVAVFFDSI